MSQYVRSSVVVHFSACDLAFILRLQLQLSDALCLCDVSNLFFKKEKPCLDTSENSDCSGGSWGGVGELNLQLAKTSLT